MKNIGLLILVLLVIFGLVGGLVYAKNKGWVGAKPEKKVVVELAEIRTMVQTVSANGKIYPEVEVIISPDVSGEIIALNVAEGDSIKAGQSLLKIEPELIQSSVERAEAAVNTAKANAANTAARITQLNAQIEKAQRELNRAIQLEADGIVSLAQKQDAETALFSLKADLEASRQSLEGANYNIKSAEATAREAKKTLARTNMSSPMTGIVSSLSVEKGERVVGTSQFQGTEIMRIAQYNSMELRVDVSENDVLKVNVGDSAIIEIDAYLDRQFAGKVSSISNASQSVMAVSNDQVTNYTVRIRLEASSYTDLLEKSGKFPFRPGMSASADIVTEVLEDVLSVPTTSVTTRAIPDSLQTEKNGDEREEVVFTAEGGMARKVPVSAGIQDDRYIQILAGLQEGEKVVTAPYKAISEDLRDEMLINVVEKDELYGSK